jgi:hypothetical protein
MLVSYPGIPGFEFRPRKCYAECRNSWFVSVPMDKYGTVYTITPDSIP